MNSPAQIAKIYSDVGSAKTKMSFIKTFVLAIFAGAFIAFGGFCSSIASCGVTPGSLARVVSAAVFPVGLMLVLCAGGELFTGNCLIALSVADKKASLKGMCRNLVIVYFGNLIGGLFVSYLAVYSHDINLFNGALVQQTVNTAVAKVNLGFYDAFLRGVLCNILVALAVWVSFGADTYTGKIFSSYLPVFIFVIGGFEHCVANMYFVPAGMMASYVYNIDAPSLTVFNFVVHNLIPVTLGNIVGGSVLVGLGYWFVFLKDGGDK